MDKLTVEDLVNFMAPYKDEITFQGVRLQYDVPHDKVLQIASQLLDTMRENEGLRQLLIRTKEAIGIEQIRDDLINDVQADFVRRVEKDIDAVLQRSKPIDTNIVYCGYCEGTGKMPCDMYNGTGIHDNPPQNRVCEHNVPWGMNCGMCQESPTTS